MMFLVPSSRCRTSCRLSSGKFSYSVDVTGMEVGIQVAGLLPCRSAGTIDALFGRQIEAHAQVGLVDGE